MSNLDVKKLLQDALSLEDIVDGLYHVLPDESRVPKATEAAESRSLAIIEKKEEEETGGGEGGQSKDSLGNGSKGSETSAREEEAEEKEKDQERAESQVPRKLVVDFLESGVAYGDEDVTEERVSCSIPLDVCDKPRSCTFSRKERVIEGVNVGIEKAADHGTRVRLQVH